jgi:hypothetical protein
MPADAESGHPVLTFVPQSLDPRVRGDERSVSSVRSVSQIQFSNSPSEIARVLCGAGYAVVPFRPSLNTRGWRAEKARQVVRLRIFLLGRCGAFRRAIAGRSTTLRTRPLSGGRAIKSRTRRAARHQPAPGRRSGRSPVTARARGLRGHARGRRVLAPPSRRLMTAPSLSRTGCNLRPLESVGISYFRCWEVIPPAAFFAAIAIGRRRCVPWRGGQRHILRRR